MKKARKKPPPTRTGFVARWSVRLVVLGLAFGVPLAIGGFFAYQEHVVANPGPHLARAAIQEVIAQESPVLYSDGRTRLGVFFDRDHREYVPFADIPRAWVDAIVAAEDERFYSHWGFDPIGITRAMLQNVRAGEVVAGGSTLTQQTAKNLFFRPDRSLRSKWEELVNALRLERHYSKEEILEFYANQFHVSANGRGLGIGARYFFDAEVGELDTLQCAFLAGMVKAPAAYNPFVGETEEKRERARARAGARTRYVLDRMLELGTLSAADHAALIEREIPFRKGDFRYDSNVVVDEVAARLEQAPFPEIFTDLGIDNPSTAGIQVVTTIDAGLQREATWALWHHLTEVAPALEGAGPAALRLPDEAAPDAGRHEPPVGHEFLAGRVVEVVEGKKPALRLDLGGFPCEVDATALRRIARALGAKLEAVQAALPAGSIAWASLRDDGACDLELRPALQGAVLVLDRGRIRAMVGGNDNRNFNRAVTARRQLGSTWKPLVYTAALQLGWTPADVLDNRDNVFVFEGTWYYPRPDHASERFVSLAWAGTRSENLATIWLLAHLTDRLDNDGFREVAAKVGLTPRPDEERDAWLVRMRDGYGVISTVERLPEAAYLAARAEVANGLEEDGSVEAIEVRSLSYGTGAKAEETRVRAGASGEAEARRLSAVRANFLRLEADGEACATRAEALAALADAGREAAERPLLPLLGRRRPDPPPIPDPAAFAGLSARPWEGAVALACGATDPAWTPVSANLLGSLAAGAESLASADEMWVDGRVRLSTLRALRRSMTRMQLVLEGADPYGLDVLQYHPDYRALVAMRYVAGLARRLGVRSDLPPVLSLPLGAVDITLEEAAVAYQGMLGGDVFEFPGQVTTDGAVPGLRSSEPVPSPETATMLVAEIRDRDGNVIYRADPAARRVSDPGVGREVGDVLRNVVRWGTGQRAREAVALGATVVPVAGKTGTTNGYKNAAFCGYVPRARPEGWAWDDGYTVAAYVGYDDNRPMRKGGVRLQGASGALPVWIGTARGLASLGLLGAEAPPSTEIADGDGFSRLAVDTASGLPGGELSADGPSILVEAEDGTPIRRFHPYSAAGGAPAPPVPPAPPPPPEPEPAVEVVFDDDDLREVWVDGMGD